MSKHRNLKTKWILLIVPLTLSVLALACGGSTTIPIRLNEEDVNRLIQKAVDDNMQEDVLVSVTDVDMQNGVIRINGMYEAENGTTVPGYLDLALSVQNGNLKAEIIAADIAGFDINSVQIVQLNEGLEALFTQAASDRNEVEFESVTITEDELEFVIKITAIQ